jgi:hypothetical protein
MDLTRREQVLLDQARQTERGDPASPYLAAVTMSGIPVLFFVAIVVVALIRWPREWPSYLWLAAMIAAMVSMVFDRIRLENTYRSLVRKLYNRQKQSR